MINEFLRLLKRKISNSAPVPADDSPLARYIDRNMLAPKEALTRLGTNYGGWTIPIDSGLTENSICYLAGAGEDISFDCAIAQQYHCKIRIIDPTPRAVQHFDELKKAVKENRRFPVNNSEQDFYEVNAIDFEKLHFLPIGLADRDIELKFYMPKNPAYVSCSTVNLQKTDTYFTAQCHRLSTIMQAQGDAKIDLLKMDIEGGEYVVIQDMIASNLLPQTLLIEFDEAHTPLDSDAGKRIKDHIEQLLKAGMHCIAIDGCNATFVKGR